MLTLYGSLYDLQYPNTTLHPTDTKMHRFVIKTDLDDYKYLNQ